MPDRDDPSSSIIDAGTASVQKPSVTITNIGGKVTVTIEVDQDPNQRFSRQRCLSKAWALLAEEISQRKALRNKRQKPAEAKIASVAQMEQSIPAGSSSWWQN